jgi:hypothetical protein
LDRPYLRSNLKHSKLWATYRSELPQPERKVQTVSANHDEAWTKSASKKDE